MPGQDEAGLEIFVYQFRQMEVQGGDDIRYSNEPEENQYILPNNALQYICQFQRGEFESNKIQPVVSGYRNYSWSKIETRNTTRTELKWLKMQEALMGKEMLDHDLKKSQL